MNEHLFGKMKFFESPSPACVEGILKWERFFCVKMPADLRAVLEKSDGPTLWDSATHKELQILGVKDAIEYFEAYEFTKNCEDAIPVSMDGCGNFVVYKKLHSDVGPLYAMSAGDLGWSDAIYLSNNFTEVIQMQESIEAVMEKGG